MLLTLKILFWACLTLVVYTYVGYGVVLWLMVRLKRLFTKNDVLPELPEDDQLPAVTLMICAYNERDIIEEKMANIRQLRYPRERLCIMWVTDGSTDDSNELLSAYPEVTLVYSPERKGKAAAMKFFNKNMAENFFQSKHIAADSLPGIEKLKPMCTFADQQLTAQDFGKYLARFQGAQLTGTIADFLEETFPNFVSENMLRYESTRLMDKYPDYRDVVNEVYDGLLIYEVNAMKVWNAAIRDTAGAEKLYEEIKEEFATGDTAQPYKPFDQVRAIVISHYQELLEKEWLDELHRKYAVRIDEEVFNSILKK